MHLMNDKLLRLTSTRTTDLLLFDTVTCLDMYLTALDLLRCDLVFKFARTFHMLFWAQNNLIIAKEGLTYKIYRNESSYALLLFTAFSGLCGMYV